MVWQRFRLIALVGAVAAAAAAPARAGDGCCTPSCCTTYKVEYRQEAYTAYKWECTPETRTRTCTTYKQVAETRNVTECVCVSVPTVEEHTVMQTYVTCKPVTHTVCKCVDRGHWECREVPCCSNSCGCGHHRRHRHCGCCEESCCESCCPPPTRTVRVWCPCKEWVQCPVTCMQRTCECRPVTCKVTVCKHEIRQVQRQVTCYHCVPECHTEQYTCMVPHCVPYQATRCVAVCVPCAAPAPTCCETTCCKPSCCNTCGESCCDSCCHHRCHERVRCCGHERCGCERCGHERCGRERCGCGGWRHHSSCCD
jgi:hypothetical protein